MKDDLLIYYERELTYLRRMGAEFAARYPKVAARLQLEPNKCEDPHVERLLEGFAFLAARVHHRLDDDLPEVSEALLDVLHPQHIRPIPSLSLVELELDPQLGKLPGGFQVERGSELRSRPVQGMPCRFRTSYATTLWPFTQLGLPLAWDTTTGSSSVTVAVLDTGVAPGALDLAGRLVAGYDIANGDADPSDDHGHGTQVASTLAGGIDNGFGSVGACPLCRIMPVKVMDSSGGGTTAEIAAGITWATDHGARIVNMSLGGPSDDPTLDAAVEYALAHNVLLIASAGNNGTTAPEYPAAIPGVVSAPIWPAPPGR